MVEVHRPGHEGLFRDPPDRRDVPDDLGALPDGGRELPGKVLLRPGERLGKERCVADGDGVCVVDVVRHEIQVEVRLLVEPHPLDGTPDLTADGGEQVPLVGGEDVHVPADQIDGADDPLPGDDGDACKRLDSCAGVLRVGVQVVLHEVRHTLPEDRIVRGGVQVDDPPPKREPFREPDLSDQFGPGPAGVDQVYAAPFEIEEFQGLLEHACQQFVHARRRRGGPDHLVDDVELGVPAPGLLLGDLLSGDIHDTDGHAQVPGTLAGDRGGGEEGVDRRSVGTPEPEFGLRPPPLALLDQRLRPRDVARVDEGEERGALYPADGVTEDLRHPGAGKDRGASRVEHQDPFVQAPADLAPQVLHSAERHLGTFQREDVPDGADQEFGGDGLPDQVVVRTVPESPDRCIEVFARGQDDNRGIGGFFTHPGHRPGLPAGVDQDQVERLSPEGVDAFGNQPVRDRLGREPGLAKGLSDQGGVARAPGDDEQPERVGHSFTPPPAGSGCWVTQASSPCEVRRGVSRSIATLLPGVRGYVLLTGRYQPEKPLDDPLVPDLRVEEEAVERERAVPDRLGAPVRGGEGEELVGHLHGEFMHPVCGEILPPGKEGVGREHPDVGHADLAARLDAAAEGRREGPHAGGYAEHRAPECRKPPEPFRMLCKPGVPERRPAEDHPIRGLDLRCADGGVVAGEKRSFGLPEKPFDRPDELVPGERAGPVAEVD